VRLDTGRLRDLGPFVELRLDERGGLFGAQAELFEAELLQPSLIVRRRKDGRHRGGQGADDVDGRIRRCREAEPGGRYHRGKSLGGEGWDLGEKGGAGPGGPPPALGAGGRGCSPPWCWRH